MYFIAGVIAKQIQVSNQKLAVILSMSIFIAIYTPSLIDIHTHKLEYGSAWLYVISSVLFYYALSKTRFDNKALVFIGQKSLAIFVVHFPVLLLIKWVEFDFCKIIYLSIIASIVAIASSITIAIILRNQKILGARIV
jgi:peptidoglycan/LPS O-acetylase OafA/YrhL